MVPCGCSFNHPHLLETITVYATNGTKTVTARESSVRSYTLLLSSENLAKQKTTIGKTMGIGTEGLGQEGVSANGIHALELLKGIADDAAKIAP